MQQASPFYRSRIVFAALSALASSGFGSVPPHIAAIANTPYRSRGHGRGLHSGKKRGTSPSGKYDGVTNGRREVARRLRQIAAGQLQVSV